MGKQWRRGHSLLADLCHSPWSQIHDGEVRGGDYLAGSLWLELAEGTLSVEHMHGQPLCSDCVGARFKIIPGTLVKPDDELCLPS